MPPLQWPRTPLFHRGWGVVSQPQLLPVWDALKGSPHLPPCGGGEMSSADIPLSARALNPGISKSSSRSVSLSSPRSRGAAGPMLPLPMLLPYPPCRSQNQNLKNHSLSFLLFSSPSCLIFFLQHVSATAPAQSVCLTSSDHPLPNTPCIRTYRVPCLPRLLAY